MSYGTYDNQSPLNQPFNPTAGNNKPGLIGGIFDAAGKVVTNAMLPGAQDPNSQQYFQQANQAHGELGEALKNIQGIGTGGGKGGSPSFGGGGKYATSFNPNDLYGQPASTQNTPPDIFGGQ